MAGIDMEVKVTGVQELKAMMDHARLVIPDLVGREFLGKFLVDRMKARFLRGVGPDEEPWEGHRAKTRPGKLLLKTRNLFESIDVIEGAPGASFGSATGAGFRIGIKSFRYTETSKGGKSRSKDTAQYGRFHQMGIGVTQRRFIGIGDSDVRAVEDRINDELLRRLG